MSLYYEAAAILANTEKTGGSFTSRVFGKKDLKCKPGQIFALIAEASKWSVVLKDIVEKCGLLDAERKVHNYRVYHENAQLTRPQLTPVLAILLTHDLLLAKSGVAASASHVLKLAITRHKARLGAEFTKTRILHGYATLDAFRQAIENGELESKDEGSQQSSRHPRWVRMNTIKTTLDQQLSTTFADFKRVDTLGEVLSAYGTSKIYHVDANIPNLLALPPKVSLGRSAAYAKGEVIFQDKASCFPAYLLDMSSSDGDVIDGCAAPGNKTTHLAAILSDHSKANTTQKVIAFERDQVRTSTLRKMVKLASADTIVSVKGSSDFLAAKPDSEEFANVGAILLDPSCSGTGIVGRDDAITMHLPNSPGTMPTTQNSGKSKKRKRGVEAIKDADGDATLNVQLDDVTAEETPYDGKLPERLATLSRFQLHILTHAMRFPNARKITYSTCSIHFEENEGVVFQALATSVAKERGWRILRKEAQVDGLKTWERRGAWKDDKLTFDVEEGTKEEVLQACIRCAKGTNEGTMGFFVAAFVRDAHPSSVDALEKEDRDDDEWNGFSNDDHEAHEAPSMSTETLKKQRRKKRKVDMV